MHVFILNNLLSGGLFMEYIKKVCPICNSEFLVLKSVEEKAFYWILKCLGKAQEDSGIQESSLSFSP